MDHVLVKNRMVDKCEEMRIVEEKEKYCTIRMVCLCLPRHVFTLTGVYLGMYLLRQKNVKLPYKEENITGETFIWKQKD